jgi:hypothetical protein
MFDGEPHDNSFPPTVYPISIVMSTTTADSTSMSATFADNEGPDAVVVFAGNLEISSPVNAAVPAPFDIEIPITPFSYPGGNLLVDIIFESCAKPTLGSTFFDYEHTGPVPMTRLWAEDKTSPTSSDQVYPGQGLVTQFVLSPLTLPTTYSVGGNVSGLTGSVTLQNNGGDDIIKTTNDGFTFPAQAEGSDYAVTVSSQPAGQNCAVTNGSGTNISANITNVIVTCVTDVVPTYTVGGTVSGLIGSVTLNEDTSGEDLALSTNGSFAFATEQVDGTPYAVTVLAQPTGQTCSVTNGSGTITTADVTNVSVACIDDVVAPPPVPMVPIPTLSQWALILLTMLIGLMAFANRRRLF